MSFSSEIKEEIVRQIPEERHCMLAEIAAIIRFTGTVSREPGNESILVETENVNVAKRYLILIRKAFDIKVNLQIQNRASARTSHLYTILLRSRNAAEELIEPDKLARLKLALQETTSWENTDFAGRLLEQSCCKRAFIRGAFLASGSMSNPGKSYHFEIVCRSQNMAKTLMDAMEEFGIGPKLVLRKNKPVVYLKDSEAIIDILNVIEAHHALMDLENVRIIKEMKNSANRQFNCDSANINKIVRTGTRQREDILYIQQKIGLDELPPMLAEMARVRLAHPDDSLQELGSYLDPPVGKSGVNHRLKKIGEIAQSLREEE